MTGSAPPALQSTYVNVVTRDTTPRVTHIASPPIGYPMTIVFSYSSGSDFEMLQSTE